MEGKCSILRARTITKNTNCTKGPPAAIAVSIQAIHRITAPPFEVSLIPDSSLRGLHVLLYLLPGRENLWMGLQLRELSLSGAAKCAESSESGILSVMEISRKLKGTVTLQVLASV